MSSGPDRFVVCKSCGSEVSPYITECPYCGSRLRKRAPKLERGGTPKQPKPLRKRPSLGRLKPGEIPGIRAERRPYVTIALVLASVAVTILFNAGLFFLGDLALGAGVTDEYWRTVTTLFVYGQNGYEIVVLAAVFLFGWLLGRRHRIEDDSDMLGVLAIAVVLVLLPLAAVEASAVAGLVGGAIGLVLGLGL